MHLNPVGRETAGRCREGWGGAARPPPANQSGREPPLPLRHPRAKIPNGTTSATRRLPPPSSASRNYVRKRSQRSPAPVRSGARHWRCRFSSTSARSPSLYRWKESFEPASVGWRRGRDMRRRDSGRARCGRWRGACGARIRSAEEPERLPSPARAHLPPRTAGRGGQKMVVLRSSLELHSHSAASATDSLNLSNEFLSLEQIDLFFF